MKNRFLSSGLENYDKMEHSGLTEVRKKQAGVSLLKTRPLTEDEKKILINNGNTSEDWDLIHVKEPFDPELVRGCDFHGFIRIGRLEKAVLRDGTRNYYCGLKNSVIISSDIGDYCSIENNDFISHVIIGKYAVISSNNEIYTTEKAEFGNSIRREGDADNNITTVDVINERGLGSLATFGALAIADYEAVVNTVKLYNEATGLIEDEKTAEKQRIDRMAMGAGVGLMRSYLELMLVRYEQNQNIAGDLLIKFWEDAEDQSKKLNTAIDQFTGTWKEIENKNYPHQLQNNCEKSCNLDENCSALISSYTALTGNSLPETRENTSSLTNEFQMVLNGNFEQNCIERSDDIKNKIEPIIQKKVDPLHKWYKSLDVCITHARQAHEKYLSNQKNYLQDNQTLNQRFEQQLAERYGKDSDKYKEGMAYLDQIRNQIKTYQPRGLKGNMEYILRRLDTIAEDFKFIKNRLVKVFDVIETHIEVINKVEKDFKSTAQLKSEELANKFETCANDMISNQTANLAEENTVPQQLAEIDQKLNFAATLSENIKNECNSTKGMVEALVSRAASNQKELIAIEAGLVDLFNKSGDFKKAEQGIKTEHASIEKQVEKAAEITHELEALSREICEKTMELNDYTRSDVVHQQNHKWIRDQKTKLKSLLDAIQLIVTNARVTHAAGGIQTDQGASPGDRSGQKIEQDLEKIAGNISAVKDSLLNANSILSGIKEKSTQAVSIKNFSLAELEKLKNYIDALPKTDSVRQMKIKYDNLSQKAGSIQTGDCVNTLSGDLINVIISFKKDEELLPKINAFYKTQKQQLLKNDSIQKSIQNTVQDISYLVDLSEAYLERAGNGAKDGALCTVLADDIMKKEFVPRVVEMKVGLAESSLSNKGFRTIKMKDNKLSSGKLPFHVTKQVPDHTKRRARGSKVEVYYYDESTDQENESLNVETAELDCSRLPGSQEMVIFDTGERLCDCPPTKTWNADFTACIDKSNALPSQDEMQKARQDLFLSMKNCSQFPGTEPVWDTQKDEAVCACKNGLILNASGNGCITPQQAAMQNIDCSPFPNTTPVWNQAQQKAVCACIQGTVLNRNGNGCIDQREVVLMNTDCSRFPGTFPEWNYQNNQPMCSCLSGSHWDDISGGCVSDTENEYLLDCSAWANTLPGWNLQTQKLECMCMSPNIIDQGTGECISWVDALIEPQNPPDNNGTNPPPPFYN